MDSNNYGDKINRIEISQARSKQKDDFPTEEEQSATRSELGKLMRFARIAWPDAIYDASAAARNFANFKPGNCDGGVSCEENEGEMLMLINLNRAISNIFQDLGILWKRNREMWIR